MREELRIGEGIVKGKEEDGGWGGKERGKARGGHKRVLRNQR